MNDKSPTAASVLSGATARPWVSESEYEGDPQTFVHANGRSIADCGMGYGTEDEANAAFIVTAVNNHEALVKALGDMIDFARSRQNKMTFTEEIAFDKARAALAGAK